MAHLLIRYYSIHRMSFSPGLGKMSPRQPSFVRVDNSGSLNRRVVRPPSASGTQPSSGLLAASETANSDQLPTLIWEEENDGDDIAASASKLDSQPQNEA